MIGFQIAERIQRFEVEVPNLKAKIDYLTYHMASLQKVKTVKLNEMRSIEAALLNCEIRQNDLRSKIVDQTEYQSLVNTLQSLEQELVEEKRKHGERVQENMLLVEEQREMELFQRHINVIINNRHSIEAAQELK